MSGGSSFQGEGTTRVGCAKIRKEATLAGMSEAQRDVSDKQPAAKVESLDNK